MFKDLLCGWKRDRRVHVQAVELPRDVHGLPSRRRRGGTGELLHRYVSLRERFLSKKERESCHRFETMPFSSMNGDDLRNNAQCQQQYELLTEET